MKHHKDFWSEHAFGIWNSYFFEIMQMAHHLGIVKSNMHDIKRTSNCSKMYILSLPFKKHIPLEMLCAI